MHHPLLAFLPGSDAAGLKASTSQLPLIQPTTLSLSRRTSLSVLVLSPWLMPSVRAQASGPVQSGDRVAFSWPCPGLQDAPRKVFC